ncbi:MAG: hypothetical protein Q4F28_01345 [Eubacteriales bacterium]|nr:hypothetical protein [Eubacteriales bacterium]
MDENVIGFVAWVIVGCFLIGTGVAAFFKKKAVGFWANMEVEPVSDIKKYNCAVGKLFVLYGVFFMLLGTPLLMGQNSPFILFSIIGVMIETIIMMVVYSLAIEKKYRKK